MKDKKNPPPRLHFAAIPLAAAANRRMGKHYKMVSQILSDLEKLDRYSALGGCAPCRSEKNVPLATSSDDKYLYVFRHQTRNTA